MISLGGREPLIIEDTFLHPIARHLEATTLANIRSYLGVPIILQDGEMFGTLCMIDGIPIAFTDKEVQAMITLTKLLSYTIDLELLNLKDPLTHLYNRKYLNLYLHQLQYDPTPHTLALFDIDYFKYINDTYGHIEGDKVLVHISCVLHDLSTTHQVLGFRFGGDEFGMIIPSVTSYECMTLLDELQSRISSYPLSDQKITVSIGLTDTTMSSVNRLVSDADDALYQSKKQGRNQYTIKMKLM